jgi:transposase
LREADGGSSLGLLTKSNFYQSKAPDEIVDILPEEKQCICGGDLAIEEGFESYQKIEIPPIKPFVTEYRIHNCICKICSKKYRSGSSKQKLLGKNAESIIASLGGFFNNSKREIKAILSQIFNLDISLGLVSKSEGRVSYKLKKMYEELVLEAENSEYLHLDETGAKNKGKLGWCWVAANKDVSVLKIMDSRGKKSLEKILPEYEGKVITDRYAVYNIFGEEKRQICLAHLRRDFKRFAHSNHTSVSMVGKSLLSTIDLVFAAHHGLQEGKLDKSYYLRRMRKLKKKMLYYLKHVSNIDDCNQARRVARNILKSFNMMWLFVNDSQIEPTNNFAERQIKHYVKYRKNSFFTWSDRGQRFIERCKSIFATSTLKKLNPFIQIQQLL